MNKVFLTGNLTRDPEVSISLRVETRLRTLEWRSTNAGQIPEVVNSENLCALSRSKYGIDLESVSNVLNLWDLPARTPNR